ncbi:hypothetical protein CPB85DRAFT_1345083 [Mucidula mucida]|nr:hypothetical protein CPB85DRAFT_1345083 [Mucidula mucida]
MCRSEDRDHYQCVRGINSIPWLPLTLTMSASSLNDMSSTDDVDRFASPTFLKARRRKLRTGSLRFYDGTSKKVNGSQFKHATPLGPIEWTLKAEYKKRSEEVHFSRRVLDAINVLAETVGGLARQWWRVSLSDSRKGYVEVLYNHCLSLQPMIMHRTSKGDWLDDCRWDTWLLTFPVTECTTHPLPPMRSREESYLITH